MLIKCIHWCKSYTNSRLQMYFDEKKKQKLKTNHFVLSICAFRMAIDWVSWSKLLMRLLKKQATKAPDIRYPYMLPIISNECVPAHLPNTAYILHYHSNQSNDGEAMQPNGGQSICSRPGPILIKSKASLPTPPNQTILIDAMNNQCHHIPIRLALTHCIIHVWAICDIPNFSTTRCSLWLVNRRITTVISSWLDCITFIILFARPAKCLSKQH